MSAVALALTDLEQDARARVLYWAAQRYDITFSQKGRLNQPATDGLPGRGGSSREEPSGSEFATFVDLYDAANPSTDIERALLGGYWFQVELGNPDFQAQSVNSALKELGYGIGNITLALGALERRRPALVRQVTKAGKTKQARKKYKLTAAGISEVRGMLNGTVSEE